MLASEEWVYAFKKLDIALMRVDKEAEAEWLWKGRYRQNYEFLDDVQNRSGGHTEYARTIQRKLECGFRNWMTSTRLIS